MSHLVVSNFMEPKAELVRPDGKSNGTFHYLNCPKHGDGLSFTDSSGSDFCLTCVEENIRENERLNNG